MLFRKYVLEGMCESTSVSTTAHICKGAILLMGCCPCPWTLTLLPMPAAGLAAESSNAGKAVTSLLRRMSKTGDPIAQDCFKLLATLMRESDSYQPSNAQLRYLLIWAFSDMEEAAGRQAAFALLKVSLPGKTSIVNAQTHQS